MKTTKRVPPPLEADYWALPPGDREELAAVAGSMLHRRRLEAEREKELAAGEKRVISFRVTPEQYRLLRMLGNDQFGCRFQPGEMAWVIFNSVWPTVKQAQSRRALHELLTPAPRPRLLVSGEKEPA